MKTKSLLRLFNAVQVEDKIKYNYSKVMTSTLSKTINNGYILDPSISPTEELLETISSVVGISGEKANASFHKSWDIVRNSPTEVLIVQQLVHYITVYGFEALGYNEDTVYLPNEVLEIPDIDLGKISLIVIKALTTDEILEKIVTLASSGIALSQETIDDVMTIIYENKYNVDFVNKVKNRELKSALYDFYGIVPSDPTEFLRHIISKLTDETLIIKNEYLIQKIKDSNGKFLDELMQKAPDNLASIFYRYKPLFLAMKSISRNKTFYNQLRKKAVVMHKPLGRDYLNSVTEQIKNGKLDVNKLSNKLTSANIFRKIRLAYALQYRLSPANSIVYTVRNGRGWATDFEWNNTLETRLKLSEAFTAVLASIANDMRKKVGGKTIVVPSDVFYALPATEKQFSGNYPSGSYISIPNSDDLIVGIYWENLPTHRVDLDLSLVGMAGKIGWDSSYRSSGRDVLFSGDVTDAPNGASELFYYESGVNDSRILKVNYYNFLENHPVDCKIIIANEKPNTNFGDVKNYMVNQNNIISTHITKIDKKQSTLGIIAKINNEVRFYFSDVSTGNSITSKVNDASKKSLEFYNAKFQNPINMSEVLSMAGANIVNEIPVSEDNDDVEDFIDLTQLDKTSIIDLLTA